MPSALPSASPIWRGEAVKVPRRSSACKAAPAANAPQNPRSAGGAAVCSRSTARGAEPAPAASGSADDGASSASCSALNALIAFVPCASAPCGGVAAFLNSTGNANHTPRRDACRSTHSPAEATKQRANLVAMNAAAVFAGPRVTAIIIIRTILRGARALPPIRRAGGRTMAF